jgi:O-antigen/teichoic acid export membrane protein
MLASVLNIASAIFNNFVFLRAVALDVPKSELGLYMFVVSIISYLGLIQAGVDLAATQYIAEATGKKKEDEANRIFHQLRIYNRTVGFILIGLSSVILVGGWMISALGWGDREWAIDFSFVTIIGCLMSTVVIRIFSNPSVAALAGGQHVHITSIANLGNALASTLIGFALFSGGIGIVSIPLGQLIAGLGTYVYLGIQRRRRCPWSLEQPNDWSQGFGRLIRFGLLVCGVGALNILDASSEPLLFRILAEDYEQHIADYGMWNRVPMLVIAIVAALLNNSTAFVTAKLHENRSDGLKFHRQIFVLSGVIAAIGTAGIGLWLSPFMHHWLKGQYDLPSGWPCGLALGLVVFAKSAGSSGAFIFYALGKGRVVVLQSAIQAISKWMLAPFLIGMAPVLGMSMVAAISSALGLLFVMTQLGRIEGYQISECWKVTGLGALSGILAFLLASRLEAVDLNTMILGMSACGAIGGGIALIALQWFRRTLAFA